MSVDVNVVMRFAANAFTAGIAKAKASLSEFGQGVGRLKKAFTGLGTLGSMFGIGAIGKILSDVVDRSRTAMATMDFSEISRKNAEAVTFMADRFTSMWDGIVSGAAKAAGAVIRFTSRVGAVAGGLFEAAVNPNVSWREGLFGAGDASSSQNDTTKQEAERRREREFQRMTRHTISGLDEMKKRREKLSELAKKEADEQAKTADELSKAAAESAKIAKGQGATLAALAVGPMSNLRAMDKQRRQEDRDARELERLQRRADRKNRNKELGIGAQNLTRREELALAARDAGGKGDPLHNIENYTKQTADTIKQALALGN